MPEIPRTAARSTVEDFRVFGVPLLMIATILTIFSNRTVDAGTGFLGNAYGLLNIAVWIALAAVALLLAGSNVATASRAQEGKASPFGLRCLRWTSVSIRMLLPMAALRTIAVVVLTNHAN